MLVVEGKRKQPKRDRTAFKRTLNKLMVSRDIFQWKDLRSRLEDYGYEIGQSQLSQYLNGQRDPEDLEELFEAIGRALDLTREEKMLLAFSYAYPQGNGKPEQRGSAPPEGSPRYPGGAKTERDFEEGLDAEAAIRAKRENQRGENGREPGDTSA
jgi:hypothetical protein